MGAWAAFLALALATAGCSGGGDGGGDAGADGGATSGGAAAGKAAGGVHHDSLGGGEAGGVNEEVEVHFLFPKQLAPQYPGSRVVRSSADENGAYMTVETPDSADKVIRHYKQKYRGWETPIDAPSSSLSAVTFVGPSGEVVSLVVNRRPAENKSIVSLTVPK